MCQTITGQQLFAAKTLVCCVIICGNTHWQSCIALQAGQFQSVKCHLYAICPDQTSNTVDVYQCSNDRECSSHCLFSRCIISTSMGAFYLCKCFPFLSQVVFGMVRRSDDDDRDDGSDFLRNN